MIQLEVRSARDKHAFVKLECPVDPRERDRQAQMSRVRIASLVRTPILEAPTALVVTPQSLSTAATIESDALCWMALVRARDECGLRRLHAGFRRKVFNCAMAIVRREEVANEVVSACFMQAWNCAASYDPERGTVTSWLLLIARSRALDALRRAKLNHSREVSVDDEDAFLEVAGDMEREPPALLERSRRQRRVQRALLRLSPIQRQVISLTTLDGLSQDEASRHLDMPLGTLKSHARRGMAALKIRCEAIGLTTS